MKQFKINIALFAVMVAFVIQGCNNDDDNDIADGNYFSYDGKEYALTKGYIQFQGEAYNGDKYLWSVLLSSDEIGYDAVESTYTGKGDLVYADIVSPSDTDIIPGTYTLGKEGDYYVSFMAGAVNFDVENEIGDYIDFIGGVDSGIVEISKEDDIYIFKISCVKEDGRELKGYYKGSLIRLEN
ncbi:MAG: hypothetical protein GXO47_03870 [Chlorobi bacterium]|nr:hypothetical protein [Chlorobiota bacterium]